VSVHPPLPLRAPSKELAALEAVGLGLHVFPVREGEKSPPLKGWQARATTRVEQVQAWWAKFPDANVGIALHGLLVLDTDNPEAERIVEDMDLPETATVLTPHGRHRYFCANVPGGGRKRLSPGLDVKGNTDGYATGYVLYPGSVVNGVSYQWDSLTDEAPIAPAPAELLRQVRRLERGSPQEAVRPLKQPARSRAEKSPAVIMEGLRNNELTHLAGRLVNAGLRTEDELYAALAGLNRSRCRPPLPEGEVRRVASSAARTFNAPPPWWGESRDIAKWCAANSSTAAEGAVLRCLCDHAGQEGRSWPSLPLLQEQTRLGRNKVRGALEGLEAAGTITVERRKQQVNRYTLRRHPLRAVEPKLSAEDLGALLRTTEQPPSRTPGGTRRPTSGACPPC
jgi:hypothetical protein